MLPDPDLHDISTTSPAPPTPPPPLHLIRELLDKLLLPSSASGAALRGPAGRHGRGAALGMTACGRPPVINTMPAYSTAPLPTDHLTRVCFNWNLSQRCKLSIASRRLRILEKYQTNSRKIRWDEKHQSISAEVNNVKKENDNMKIKLRKVF